MTRYMPLQRPGGIARRGRSTCYSCGMGEYSGQQERVLSSARGREATLVIVQRKRVL